MARELLGKRLWLRRDGGPLVARILEVEAYLGATDPAAHSFRGPTPRNRVMFGRPGVAYVYLVYGIHHCLNVVTGPEGTGEAVLIRAVGPVPGEGRHSLDRVLAGPGLLCRELGIDLATNGWDLAASDLRVLEGPAIPDAEVRVGPRVGLTKAADLPLRFRVAGVGREVRAQPPPLSGGGEGSGAERPAT